MKKSTTEELLIEFENAAIKYSRASESGNSKIVNENYNKMMTIVKKLLETDSVEYLNTLLNSDSIGCRVWVAYYLLPISEKCSKSVLKEISKMSGMLAFDAKMTLQEWKNGNLKSYLSKFYGL